MRECWNEAMNNNIKNAGLSITNDERVRFCVVCDVRALRRRKYLLYVH